MTDEEIIALAWERARERKRRLDRSAHAVAEGLRIGGGAWWPALAPLTPHERDVVRRYVADQITYECAQRAWRR